MINIAAMNGMMVHSHGSGSGSSWVLDGGVGITSPLAVRCDSVTDPSEFGHMMTIFALAIAFPKPTDY